MTNTDDTTATDNEPESSDGLDATDVQPEDDFDGADDTPDPDGDVEEESRAEVAGSQLGKVTGRGLNGAKLALGRFTDSFLYTVSKFLGTDAVWRKRHRKLIKRMYKSTDADAIGFVAGKKGEILPTPVKYRPPSSDSDDDEVDPHGYWEAGHIDQTFSAATGEVSTEHINNIPVVFLHTDDWAESSFSGALLAEAVDLGHGNRVYRDPEFNVVQLLQEDTPGGEAMADGGSLTTKTKVEEATAGQLDDFGIDVGISDLADGMRVSWEKFKELRVDKTSVEAMHQAEQRGWLAAKEEAQDDRLNPNVKWYVLGMVALALGGFWMGAQVGGGGGGGSGGGGGGGGFIMSVASTLKLGAVGVGWL